MASELEPCPFCSKTMMLRSALWPSEGDADAIIHADPTDCPMLGFSDGSADGSIIEKWNCSLSNEDDFPSDGSCVRCGSVPRNANGLCNTCLDEDAERLENTRTTPVAPVSPDTDGKCGELVTVGGEYLDGHTWKPMPAGVNDFALRGFKTRALCDRSQAEELLSGRDTVIEMQADSIDKLERKFRHWQERADKAEELLAAERAEKEAWMKSAIEQQKRVKWLEADNAAKDARIKELEARVSRDDEIFDKLIQLGGEADEKFEALEAKLAAAEMALETEKALADRLASALEYIEGYSLCYPDLGIITGVAQPALEAHTEARAAIRAVLGGQPS